jgi:uncharacterized cupin superfamily protein
MDDSEEPAPEESNPDGRIVAPEDHEWTTTERGDREYRRAQLGQAAGSEKLGCSLYEVPPGKKAWPYHFHTGNEEAMYVLSGEATVRTAEGERTVPPGSYAAFPAGEAGAHEVRNDGDEPLRYLAVSTMRDPDVTAYPDSGKIGVFAGSPPGGRSDERVRSGYFYEDHGVDYWEGEVATEGGVSEAGGDTGETGDDTGETGRVAGETGSNSGEDGEAADET